MAQTHLEFLEFQRSLDRIRNPLKFRNDRPSRRPEPGQADTKPPQAGTATPSTPEPEAAKAEPSREKRNWEAFEAFRASKESLPYLGKTVLFLDGQVVFAGTGRGNVWYAGRESGLLMEGAILWTFQWAIRI